MPNGTTMNEVFVARIHKSNASQVAEDARDSVAHATQRLLVLAAATPTADEKEMLVNDVADLVDELIGESWREWAAGYIKENDGLCIDDLIPER